MLENVSSKLVLILTNYVKFLTHNLFTENFYLENISELTLFYSSFIARERMKLLRF